MPEVHDGLHIFRNRLPQWRLDGGIYFISWCLALFGDQLSPSERTIVANEIKRFKDIRYRLAIYVVMDDHVHALIQTLNGIDLGLVLKGWKGSSSRAINQERGTIGTRWEKDSYTELLGNQAAIQSRREYIYLNPQQRWGIEPPSYEWLEWFE